MKTIASLDIGSNSILMLVAKATKDKKIIPLFEASRAPRLALNLKKTGKISDQSLKRAVRDIDLFKKEASKLGAAEIFAVGTAALRVAGNRNEVLNTIYEQTGVRVEVISEAKEAELTYRGAITGFCKLKEKRIFFDIGGASLEVVLATGKRIQESVSLKIGAVEITERYHTDGRKSISSLEKIDSEIQAFLGSHLKDFDPVDSDLIGSGGTISTYKLLDSRPEGFRRRLIHTKSLKLSRLDELIKHLAVMKLSERKRVIIFEPDRATVIVAGGLILRGLLRYLSKNSVRVSVRSLRWGFLLSKL